MKTNIKLPAPMLSQLKEVNAELCMKGRHYAEIAVSDGQLPEEVALGILQDLMDEDANKLTLNELRYVFTMVKIYSLENKYDVYITCTHLKKDGTQCGCENVKEVKLSDSDLNHPPKKYQPPEIDFTVEGNSKKYIVMPPTMDMECAVLNWFLTEKGITREQLVADKKQSFDFTFARSVMHLVDKETNERLVKEITDFDGISKLLDENDYKTIHQLYEDVEEVGSFGLAPKLYEITCKECGGTLVYHLPLLDGLVS